jgi:hypothetical protein
MDYWCALWFWPITRSADLPSREQWWMEVGILEGNVVEIETQRGLDFTHRPGPPATRARGAARHWRALQPTALSQPTGGANPPNLHDKLGQLRISKLRQHFPRGRGGRHRRAAPLYALGAVLCRCAAGRRPARWPRRRL